MNTKLSHYSILKQATEVFISNSIRGLWPVKSACFLDGSSHEYELGPVYQRLARNINQELGHPGI